jgi:hypothetical protein
MVPSVKILSAPATMAMIEQLVVQGQWLTINSAVSGHVRPRTRLQSAAEFGVSTFFATLGG